MTSAAAAPVSTAKMVGQMLHIKARGRPVKEKHARAKTRQRKEGNALVELSAGVSTAYKNKRIDRGKMEERGFQAASQSFHRII